MKLALYQMSPVWENKEASMVEIQKTLQASPPEVDLLIFPEMSLTGFTMNADRVVEDVQGTSVSFFCEIAKQYHTAVIGGLVLGEDGNNYNCALYADKNGIVQGVYRKMHPFSYSGEGMHYTAGGDLAVVMDNGMRIGLTICYDLRFPELYRLYAKQGVDLMVNIANWPLSRINHWQALLEARAIENQCFIAGVNRIGKDPALGYNGRSAVIDPMGSILIELGISNVVGVVEIDPGEVPATRKRFPFLEDMKLI